MQDCEERNRNETVCSWPYTAESNCIETYAEAVGPVYEISSGLCTVSSVILLLVLAHRAMIGLIDASIIRSSCLRKVFRYEASGTRYSE